MRDLVAVAALWTCVIAASGINVWQAYDIVDLESRVDELEARVEASETGDTR